MKLIGITGGIGMGKSVSGKLLRERNYPVADTDEIARHVVEPGEPALEEVRNAFGSDIIDAQGRLRRDLLAQLVFGDPAARRILESILHPRIRCAWRKQAEQWAQRGEAVGFVVIPLLFETDAETAFAATVCVACSREAQKRRLLERGWTWEQARQRIEAQWPIEKKLEKADHVIWTDIPLQIHVEQWECLLARLK